MGIKIVTDSLSGLSAALAAQYAIEVIPHRVAFGTQTLRDGVDLTPEEFLQRLETSKSVPTFTPPVAEVYQAVFGSYLGTGDEVVFIAPSSKMSASYQNAEEARRKLSTPHLQVLDSKSFAAGQALLAIDAAEVAPRLGSAAGLAEYLSHIVPRIQVVFYLDDLSRMVKSGRLGGAQGFLGNLMRIKPVLTAKDGVVAPLSRVRTTDEAVHFLATQMQDVVKGAAWFKLAVMHAGDRGMAEALVKGLAEVTGNIGQNAEMLVLEMPSGLSVMTGRGACGLAYFTSQMTVDERILAEGGKPFTKPRQVPSKHPAQPTIDQAARAADRFIHLTALTGGQAMLEVNSQDAAEVVALIDKALAATPEDVDLLVAKSGALRCAMQFKTAEEVLDQALALAPDHFDARMSKAHWDTWKHTFQFPSWSSETTTLHPLMAQKLQDTHTVQLVRDGLQLGITIVRPASARDFPSGLSNSMPCKWVPVWSDTPYGPILAHYLIVYDDPANPYKGEGFMSLKLEREYHPEANFWLLQRLCTSDSCYLALADGARVLFNVRYTFPPELKSRLADILHKRQRLTAELDSATFLQACQWHMNHFDMGNVG